MNLNSNLRGVILRAIMQDVPTAFISDKQAQEMLYNAMSEQCKALYLSNKEALRGSNINSVVGKHSRWLIVGDADAGVVFKEIVDKAVMRYDAERELSNIIEGCRTVKQLEKMLPEFKNHFPKPAEQLKNLPISNMVSKLVQLGWNGTAVIEHKAQ